jgi:hypothetical protein
MTPAATAGVVMKHSRLAGAAVGFLAGAAIGFDVTVYLYGTDFQGPVGWLPRIVTALVVGAVGALLGSLSGLSKG